MSHHHHFFRAFLRNLGHVGAIAPSSERLADAMVDWLNWETIQSVIEFGSGTGVFTEAVAERASKETRFIAIERDPKLVEIARERCPDVEIHEDCVSNVVHLAGEAGIDKADAIICGLPWASFSKDLQDRCLQAMFEVLPHGGQFSTFAYWQGLALPSGQRFRKFLHQNFSSVEQSQTVWRNLPPAFVYRCVR